MSNFDFMNQNNLIEQYPSFSKMYEYIIAAENAYYTSEETCGINVRWALEQFCCIASDLKQVNYEKFPTYMGEFLSPDNKFQLLIAVDGYVNYRTICEVNAISRTYAHSIMKPDKSDYPEMLPKMFGLIVWLYKAVLGIEIALTYSSFTYDRVPKGNKKPFLIIKEDNVHISSGQLEGLRELFPNCKLNTQYSIQQTTSGLQMIDENGNIIESFVHEGMLQEDIEEKKKLEEEIKACQNKEQNIKQQYEGEIRKQKQKIRKLKSELAEEQCNSSSKVNRIGELTKQIEFANREKEDLQNEYEQKISRMQGQRDYLQQAYDELLSEKEKNDEMQKQLRESIEIRNRQKNNLENEVKKLIMEVAEADRKINKMESSFQTKSEAYQVMVKMKNMLLTEKERLERLLKQARDEYEQLNLFMKEEVSKYKNNQIHLETLLANAQAQTAYYKKIVDGLKEKTNEDTALMVVDNVNSFHNGYEVYQKSNNEEAFRNVLIGIRNIIDDIRIEVEEERTQRKEEKKETDRKINKVERIVKKNLYAQKILLIILLTLSVPLAFIVVFLAKQNSELQKDVVQNIYEETQLVENEVKLEKDEDYITDEMVMGNLQKENEQVEIKDESISKEEMLIIEDNNVKELMGEEDENDIIVNENLNERTEEIDEYAENEKKSALPDNSKLNEIIDNYVRIVVPEDFTAIPGLNEELLEEVFYINSLGYEHFDRHPDEFDIYDRIEIWCVDEYDFFAWTDDDMAVPKFTNKIKFVSYMNRNLMYAVALEDFVDTLDQFSTFEDCKLVFGDNFSAYEKVHPTSFSTSQEEDVTIFCLEDGSKVLLGWNMEGQICDYVYFYPLVDKYVYKVESAKQPKYQ